MVKTSNKLVQSYFDCAEVFMIALSSDEMVIDINRMGCEILGCTKEEIVGRKWFDSFLPEAEKEKVKRLFHEILAGTLPHVHYEHSTMTKQGEKRIFNWHNILVRDEKGSTIGLLSSGAEVTERRQIEKEQKVVENRLKVTLDSMLEGCQIIDYDWRYAYVNEAVVKQSRQTKQELMGHNMREVYPEIERTELFSQLQNCMTNRVPHNMETEFVFPDGTRGWFELHIEPVPEGLMILSLDITMRKNIETELAKYRQRLEEVVTTRTAECVEANKKLTEKIHDQQKTEEGLTLRAMILDNVIEAIFLVNTKGDFTYANEAASKTYGYSLDEFLNMNLRQLLQHPESETVELRLGEVIEKGELQFETVHVRKDKSLMLVQARHKLIKTPHGKFIVTAVRNNTQSKD